MKNCLNYRPRFDILENRLVPATLVNPNTVTYRDGDGQKVTVTISKPVFDINTINNVFTFTSGNVDTDPTNDAATPEDLQLLDLTTLAAGGATLKVTTIGTTIGRINATGLDLAAINAPNTRLGELDAGDANLDTPALGLLRLGALQGPGTPTTSNIQGDINQLQIKGELAFTFMDVTGSIGSALVGGISSDATNDSGRLRVSGSLGSLLVDGNIDGSSGSPRCGSVEVGGNIGSVKVLGDIFGGIGNNSGQIFTNGSIGSVTVTGEITLATSAAGQGTNSARIRADDNIGKVKIGGRVHGDDGANSGSIQALTGSIGSVKIGGDLEGGTGARSGHIAAGRTIGKIRIGGSLFAGTGFLSGVIAADDSINQVTIGGDIVGIDDEHRAGIIVRGLDDPTGLAIGKVTVLDEMNFGFILAGYDPTDFLPIDADAGVGKVNIAGNFTASLIAVGTDAKGDARFATADDTAFDESPFGGDEPPLSHIDKVTIGGQAGGTGVAGDHFGIVAQEIGSVKVGGVALALTSGLDVIELAVGVTDDVTVREV